ncbi:hypothetical protein FGE12_26875 [Aggregicoccus sp. 17bor-14]|nr:hypothetical protein [Simulacricoccus sp. 17bor-14]MRI91797.1 hypothetical protein [Aggregicoccus sp. 17bor-14]
MLLLALPAPAQTAGAAPRASRARVSANGLYTVRLVETAPGQCRLEVGSDAPQGSWSVERCVGSADDLYFVANDGATVWVLRPLAEKPAGTEQQHVKKGKAPAWAAARVAWEVVRPGELRQELRLSGLVPTKRLSEVRQFRAHFGWLEGTLGIPGKGPRLTDAGEVEFETVDGKTHRLKF